MIVCIFFIPLLFGFILLVGFLSFLMVHKNKIIDVLYNLGFKDYSKSLQKLYIPIRGTSVLYLKETNEAWRKIKTMATDDVFLKRVQYILKGIYLIKIFEITFVSVGVLSGIIYLVIITI